MAISCLMQAIYPYHVAHVLYICSLLSHRNWTCWEQLVSVHCWSGQGTCVVATP